MDYRIPLPDVSPGFNPIERVLIWLSGAEETCLRKCPKWEKRKYEAFGASVLVPMLFGMIGSSYAISTLTDNLVVIVGFAMIWGFIILTIDRVLLATYRAFTTTSKKVTQFVLRLVVAVLMGLTVSHPLTLLLFKDTINSEIEKQRTKEMAVIREEADVEKQAVEKRITQAAENLAQLQKKYEETIAGDFVTGSNDNGAVQAVFPAVEDTRFDDIDAQLAELKAERETIREGLEKWQKTYDEEVGGSRGGAPGVGPKARAIEQDHLVWRREEMNRLNGMISEITARRVTLSSALMEKSAAANEAIEARKRELEKQKLDMFTSQQGQMVDVIREQIESSSRELDRIRAEAKQLAIDTSDRLASLKTERRADMMTQTIVLHHLFEDPANGGHFALMVYVIIASLFTLIDTLPLVVKFFSVAGPYDMVQHIEGTKYTPFHKLSFEADSEEFDKRDLAFRRQMQARIDMFRDVDSYWGKNIPVLPNEGAPRNEAEVEALFDRPSPVPPKPVPPVEKEEKPTGGFGDFMSATAESKKVEKEEPVKTEAAKPTEAEVKKKLVEAKERKANRMVSKSSIPNRKVQPRKPVKAPVAKKVVKAKPVTQTPAKKAVSSRPVPPVANRQADKPVLQRRKKPLKATVKRDEGVVLPS